MATKSALKKELQKSAMNIFSGDSNIIDAFFDKIRKCPFPDNIRPEIHICINKWRGDVNNYFSSIGSENILSFEKALIAIDLVITLVDLSDLAD
jgi:hypothetical protein